MSPWLLSRWATAGIIPALWLSASSGANPSGFAAERRGKAFWLALAPECSVPAAETAFGLVSEALELVASPDSGWRDKIGYEVVVGCAYVKHALTVEQRRVLVSRLEENLRQGLGEVDSPSVLRRSFSALDLSVFAALENENPALDAKGYGQLLDDALYYLGHERDLRGFDTQTGWIHAVAHGADLLKFLAHDARFTVGDQQRVFDAIAARFAAVGTPVFTHGEQERLAAPIATIIRRRDFDVARLDPWLQRFVDSEKRVWEQSPLDEQALNAVQNGRQFLQALYVLLTLPSPAKAGSAAPPSSPGENAARSKLLSTLTAIRR